MYVRENESMEAKLINVFAIFFIIYYILFIIKLYPVLNRLVTSHEKCIACYKNVCKRE